jgi:ribonucleotide reductase alpha subunit
LHDGDVCNLGSINLEKFVVDGDVDYDQLSRTTMTAVRMLDNVIDLSDFPVDRVNSTSKNNRRIGLGIMGFADMLYQLRIGYDTEQGRDVARRVMRCIQAAAERQSELLAEQKGCFANWDKSVFAATNTKRRNAALTNIAPTGTIAMSYNVSGGVEPYFALAYHYRGILGGDVRLEYFNKHLASALKQANCFTPEIVARVHAEGTLQNIDELPEHIKRTFVTSMDISARDHILMQAAMQEHCDNAISKTINFANSATRADILDGYITAWQNKCKGCTVYRDGSRVFQILNLNEGDKSKDEVEDDAATATELATPTPAIDDDDDSENSPIDDNVANITVRVPLAPASKKRATTDTTSNIDAGLGKKQRVLAAAAIEKVVAESSSSSSNDVVADKAQCPDCSDKLVFQEGCCTCMGCGFSMCSRA